MPPDAFGGDRASRRCSSTSACCVGLSACASAKGGASLCALAPLSGGDFFLVTWCLVASRLGSLGSLLAWSGLGLRQAHVPTSLVRGFLGDSVPPPCGSQTRTRVFSVTFMGKAFSGIWTQKVHVPTSGGEGLCIYPAPTPSASSLVREGDRACCPFPAA